MKRLALAAALLLTVAPAYAQSNKTAPKPVIEFGGPCNPLGDTRPECQAKGSPAPFGSSSSATPQQVWQNIVGAATADLTYAKALADSANTANSKLRSTCYAALIAANQQVSGANIPKDANGNPMAMPDPALITKAEQGLEIIDSLQPSAPLIVACAPAANAVQMGVLSFINTVVTGAALKAASGGILP